MLGKKVLPASRLCGQMEMGERKWLECLFPQRALRKRRALPRPLKIIVPQQQHHEWHMVTIPSLGRRLGLEVAGGEGAFTQLTTKSPLTQPDTLVLAFPPLHYTRINLGLSKKPHQSVSAPDPPLHDQGQGWAFARLFPYLVLPPSFSSPVFLWGAENTEWTCHILH